MKSNKYIKSIAIIIAILLCTNTVYADNYLKDTELEILKIVPLGATRIKSEEVGELNLKKELSFKDYEIDLRNFIFYFNDKTTVTQLDKKALEYERDILLKNKNMRSVSDLNLDIARIIAKTKNGHSFSVNRFGESYLPIMIEKIGNGFYITDATNEYKELLYKKIDKINDVDIEKVHEKIIPYCSGENEYIKKFTSKFYYFFYSDIYIKEAIINGDKFELTYIEDGNTLNKIIKLHNLPNPKIIKNYYNNYDGFTLNYSENYNPRNNFINYSNEKQNKDKNFYFYKKDNSLIIKYNQCIDDEKFKIDDMNRNIDKFLDNNKINNIILDLRDNTGGYFNHVFKMAIQLMKIQDKSPDSKIKILIGNKTYSACTFLLNLSTKYLDNVELVGGNTGVSPFFTSTSGGKIYLGKSGLIVQLSEGYVKMPYDAQITKNSINLNMKEDTWVSDMFIENQIQDYAIGNDKIMNYALRDER